LFLTVNLFILFSLDLSGILYFLASPIMILLLQCKQTNAQNSSESQQRFDTSYHTCFGPHGPIVVECTVAQNKKFRCLTLEYEDICY